MPAWASCLLSVEALCSLSLRWVTAGLVAIAQAPRQGCQRQRDEWRPPKCVSLWKLRM